MYSAQPSREEEEEFVRAELDKARISYEHLTHLKKETPLALDSCYLKICDAIAKTANLIAHLECELGRLTKGG